MDNLSPDILKRLVDPDPETRRQAMRPFVEITFPAFYHFVFRKFGDEASTEDVVMEVYAGIWEKPEPLRRGLKQGHNLTTTVYLYYMRTPIRRELARRGRTKHLSQQRIGEIVCPVDDPLETSGDEDVKDCLRDSVKKLPRRERHLIELRLSGTSFRHIAFSMSISLNCVKVRAHRTYKKLRTLIVKCLKKK